MSKNRGLKLLFFKYKGSKVHLLKIEIFIIFSRLMNEHGNLRNMVGRIIMIRQKITNPSGVQFNLMRNVAEHL